MVERFLESVNKMGERTQLLFRVTNAKTKKVEYSVIYHYQVGYGRKMIMDALHLVTSSRVNYAVVSMVRMNGHQRHEKLERKMKLYNILKQQCDDFPYTWDTTDVKTIYQETQDKSKFLIENEKDLFTSDNNDGWMIVDLKVWPNSSYPQITFSFYQELPTKQKTLDVLCDPNPISDEKAYDEACNDQDIYQCSLEQFEYFSSGRGATLATPRFIKAYRVMLESYDIKEAEIKNPVETDFVHPNYEDTQYPKFSIYNDECNTWY